ncbi:hypothetical protein P8X24_03715 [Pyrococcus kukulkanii]|uniref:hypothetical protein n=1 Tax=Pyrococcus kukulkanii TaxID=1609559 RepID=UPI000F2A3ADD|nr:MAG: hypothetical protein DRN82_04585 [Thermococci archaeon]
MVDVTNVLLEVRPYIEYYERLKELVESLSKESPTIEELITKLEDIEKQSEEPFKTDIRILLNHLRSLR